MMFRCEKIEKIKEFLLKEIPSEIELADAVLDYIIISSNNDEEEKEKLKEIIIELVDCYCGFFDCLVKIKATVLLPYEGQEEEIIVYDKYEEEICEDEGEEDE